MYIDFILIPCRPPPPTRPQTPPAPPSQPDQLYTQPQTGDASGNTGSVMFPGNLNQQQAPPNNLPSPSPTARPPAGRPSAPALGTTPPQVSLYRGYSGAPKERPRCHASLNSKWSCFKTTSKFSSNAHICFYKKNECASAPRVYHSCPVATIFFFSWRILCSFSLQPQTPFDRKINTSIWRR